MQNSRIDNNRNVTLNITLRFKDTENVEIKNIVYCMY